MKRARCARSREVGAALAFVVLLVLALFALGHGIVVSSLGQLSASRASLRQLEAGAAADGAARVALDHRAGPWMDSVGLWEPYRMPVIRLGRAEGSGALRRIGAEAWLVEGAGRVGGGGTTRTARLAWFLDPMTRIVSLEAAVSVGTGAPVTLAGPIDASAPTTVEPPLGVTDCQPWIAGLAAHYRSDPLVAVATLADTTAPGLGLLDFVSLLTAVDVRVVGRGAPQPAESLGACDDMRPWNWGDPERPWRPCGSYLSLRGSEGDLYVDGGAGQGVLVVDGDLTLAAGTRYHGLAITSGALRLEGGAFFEGMASAGGGVHVAAGATVRGSACWAVRALSAQRETLGRLLLVPGTGRIGPL